MCHGAPRKTWYVCFLLIKSAQILGLQTKAPQKSSAPQPGNPNSVGELPLSPLNHRHLEGGAIKVGATVLGSALDSQNDRHVFALLSCASPGHEFQ